MVRAIGSYPVGRGFKSLPRYQKYNTKGFEWNERRANSEDEASDGAELRKAQGGQIPSSLPNKSFNVETQHVASHEFKRRGVTCYASTVKTKDY